MRELVAQRRDGRIDDTLVLVEHPPVVTVGVQGDDGSAVASGLPVVRVERGGHATYHGPGQLVGYPIVDLAARGHDVRRFVRDVEAVVARALVGFGIEAGHLAGQPGVWVGGRRKIASIGIAVDHWVTSHGFALNVGPELSAFGRFRPCGLDGAVMTSISKELGRTVAVGEARPGVVEGWWSVFDAPEVIAPLGPGTSTAPAARR